MLVFIIIVVVVLAVTVYSKYDTISPKLVVKEGATWAGSIVGATPEVARTTIKVAKAINAQAEADIRESGQDAPLGFKEGRVVTKKYIRDSLAPTNQWADDTLKEANERLAKMCAESK